MNIAEIRAKYPQYSSMSDDQLADALHRKFYSSMPKPIFNAKIGLTKRGEGGHNAPEFQAPGPDRSEPRSQAASAAYGAADMAGLGFGDELASYAGSAISGKPRDQVLAEMRGNQQEAQTDNPGSYLAGQVAGGVAQAAAMGPASFTARMGGAGIGKAALGSGVDGALIGAGYGAGSGENAQERALGGALGAATGGVVGVAAPYVAAGASNLARRAVSPFTAAPERQAAISTLEREGVPLTAGQRTGSERLRYRESELGGNRADDIMRQQGEAFTDAAMRRAGASGLANSDNLAGNQARLGQGFNDVSARNTLTADQQFLGDMVGTLREYNRVLPSEQKQILGNIASDIGDRIKAGGGRISGDDYQTIRSRLTKRAHNARINDPELADAYRGLRNSLDSAMDRSIRPEDAGIWAGLRREYGNQKTLEKAIASAGGEDAATGVISPARLRMASSSGNKGGYARGEGDFAELAKAGQAVMTPLPNSGTAKRLAAQYLIPAVAGSAYGGSDGNWQNALLGAGAGLALPKIVGALMMSKGGQAYLGNQKMAGNVPPAVRNIISALISRSSLPPANEAASYLSR